MVTDKITCFQWSTTAGLQPCNALLIQPGDFVDVKVVAQILAFPSSNGGREVRVDFAIKQVILLKVDPLKRLSVSIKLIMCNLQVSAVQAPMMHYKINFRMTQLVQACGHSLVFLAMAIAIVLQC